MALIHAMYGVMTGTPPADSWADPYGFSTFSQAVNNRTRPEEIGVSFGLGLGTGRDLKCDFRFQSFDNSPLPVATRLKHNDVWVEVKADTEGYSNALRFGTAVGSWQIDEVQFPDSTWPSQLMQVLAIILEALPNGLFRPLGDSFPITDKIKSHLLEFQKMFTPYPFVPSFAGGAIRSKPKRTYDPVPFSLDSEGANIPMYLAYLARNDEEAWENLQAKLQVFGQSAGLFEEIHLRSLGDERTDPFQIQVKEYIKDGEGETRNIIDVGYGVNQILPVVTVLLRQEQTPLFLLQQPEVHLHPSAQAALGSFFCDFASWDQQLIVETHSDHLVDRVRMDVRDQKARLTNDDVLILFFERVESDVKIHPIRFDTEGNVVDAPDSYRRFFMDETTRSIGW